MPEQVDSESSPAQRSQHRFAWLLHALVAVALCFVLLWRTLDVGFFTVDDSDTLRVAKEALEQIGETGNPFVLFKPGSHAGVRYWPVFAYWQVLRLSILGLNPVAWHVVHCIMYAIIGLMMVDASRRLGASPWGGLVALGLLLATGTIDYQSNWYNFVSLFSNEPLLLFLLSVGIAALASGSASVNKFRSGVLLGTGTLLLLCALATKEVAAPTILLATLPLVLLHLMQRKFAASLFQLKRPLFAISVLLLVAAISWLALVLVLIPRGEEYAGTGTLVSNPVAWIRGLAWYGRTWMAASYLCIPLAVLHYFVRIIRNRANLCSGDIWQGMLMWWSLCLIAPLLLWPERHMRLSQPAYAFMLLFTAVESSRFVNRIRSINVLDGRPTMPVIAGIVLSFLLAVLGKTVLPWGGFKLAIVGMATAWLGCSMVFMAQVWNPRLALHRWKLALVLGGVAFNLIVTLALIVINLIGWFPGFNSLEGVRMSASSRIANSAATGARVAWIQPPNLDVFAWSAGMHARIVCGRGDLVEGPFPEIGIENSTLRRGDKLVYTHLGGTIRAPQGIGELESETVSNDDVMPALTGIAELHSWIIHRALPPADDGVKFASREQSGWVVIHTVVSDEYTVDKDHLRQFYPGWK